MNTTSHIEAFNAELMDAKREALAAIRAIVRTSNPHPAGENAPPAPDPRILAQARMAATQVLRTAFLKPEPAVPTKRDREGASPTPATQDPSPPPTGEKSRATASAREGAAAGQTQITQSPAPTPTPNPVNERRQRQIARMAEQARRDLERYQAKILKREARELRRAENLTARMSASSTA